MRKTLTILAALISLTTPSISQAETCLDQVEQKIEHAPVALPAKILEKEILEQGKVIEKEDYSYYFLSFETEIGERYDIGAVVPKGSCNFKKFFAHRFIKVNDEYIPVTTFTDLKDSYGIRRIADSLPKNHHYANENVPLSFLLDLGKATKVGDERYIWNLGQITAIGEDQNRDGSLDRLTLTEGHYTYEDIHADSLSFGDVQYFGSRPEKVSLHNLVGHPIEHNLYVSTTAATELIEKARDAIKK